MQKPLLAALLLSLLTSLTPADTIGWRTNGTGLYPDSTLGLTWAPNSDAIAWSVPLAKWSNATPLLLADRIIVSEEPDLLLCLQKNNGKELWRQTAGYEQAGVPAPEKNPRTHETNGYTSPTPASDGKHIATFNGLGIAACYTTDGKQLWIKHLASPTHGWGTSASVLISENKALFHVKDTLHALDLTTGKPLWQAKSSSRWGTPVLAKVADTTLIITPSGDFIDASSGKILASKIADLNYNSPVVHNNIAYFLCGEKGCVAVKLPEKIADDWKPEILWSSAVTKRNRTYASPVIHDSIAYLLAQSGRLSAFDTTNGKLLWENDMQLGGTAYPSLVLAGKNLLVSSDSGKTAVLTPGKEFKEIARNSLDPFRSTPVLSENLMYVRTSKGLVCVKGANPQ